MIKHIYKIKNKIVDGSDIENPITNYEDIEPQLLASVEVRMPKPYKTIDEEGIEKEIVPELNLNKFYPLWDKETMIASDVRFKEPKMFEGKLTEGYVEPVIIPKPVVPYIPTDEEKLEQLKQDIIRLTREIAIENMLDLKVWTDPKYKIIERDKLVQEHKELAFDIEHKELAFDIEHIDIEL